MGATQRPFYLPAESTSNTNRQAFRHKDSDSSGQKSSFLGVPDELSQEVYLRDGWETEFINRHLPVQTSPINHRVCYP